MLMLFHTVLTTCKTCKQKNHHSQQQHSNHHYNFHSQVLPPHPAPQLLTLLLEDLCLQVHEVAQIQHKLSAMITIIINLVF